MDWLGTLGLLLPCHTKGVGVCVVGGGGGGVLRFARVCLGVPG